MIRHLYEITCDRTGEDGIACIGLSARTPAEVESVARENHWISGDGYHECPRHPQ